MAKKVTDAQCLSNYASLCELFAMVVPDAERFEVVYAMSVDVQNKNFVVFRQTNYNYSNFALGYDADANEIVFLPVDRLLQGSAEPYYMKRSDIKKAKYSRLMRQFTVYDSRIKGSYLQFTVPEHINQDPEEVAICVKQDKQAAKFTDFYREQFAGK